MLIIIIVTIVMGTVMIIANQLGIAKGFFSSISCKTSLSISSFERRVKFGL